MDFTQLDPNVVELLFLWAVLALTLMVGGWVIMKTRPKPIQQEPTAGEMLSKCREMHSRGKLSDAEFRTIKATLNERIQNELRDDDQTGCDA
ncbi:MAG: hypothetical protein JW719_13550 [Pirellulales bacterium]|nr:hypothetical protein [Pirellulales bacterium]